MPHSIIRGQESKKREAVIVDAVRTPMGRRDGMLKRWHPVDLLGHTLSGLVQRNKLNPDLLDDLIAGCDHETYRLETIAFRGRLCRYFAPSPCSKNHDSSSAVSPSFSLLQRTTVVVSEAHGFRTREE